MTRAARDFLKAIVTVFELEARDALISELEKQVAFIHFLLKFSSLTCLLTVTVSCLSSHSSFSELSLLTLLIQS